MGRLLFKICGLREISFRSVLQCTLKEAVIPRIRQNNLHNLSGRATGADQKNVTSDPRSKLFYEIVAKTMAQREKRYLTDPNAQLTFYMMRKMRRVCEEIDDAAPMPQNAQISTPQPPPILNSSVEMCEMQRQLGTHITMPVVENLIGEMSCGPLTTEKQTESIVIMDDVPPRGNGIDPGDTLLHAEEMLRIPLEDLVDKPCGATDNSDDISQEALWSDDEESQNGHPGNGSASFVDNVRDRRFLAKSIKISTEKDPNEILLMTLKHALSNNDSVTAIVGLCQMINSICDQEILPETRYMFDKLWSVRYPYMIPAPKPRTVEHTLASAQKALTTGKAQDGVVTVSPLFKLNGFDPIWGFSPEYMHFQLCGNVKQFTEEIISTLSPSEFELVNRLIVEIRAPNQLCRLSKSLQFKSEYKCKDWENFALYYSIPVWSAVLKKPEDKKRLKHWSKLVKSLYMSLGTDITYEDLNTINTLNHEFVKDIPRYLGFVGCPEWEQKWEAEKKIQNIQIIQADVTVYKSSQLSPVFAVASNLMESNRQLLFSEQLSSNSCKY
ncbi:hypothetical protein QAD02_023982 [Eretmocerus hayati]|uniref:Uncharacterized protein n=1 Tax=Eretmocerus hayati TaxID=131215 RepID=A0ACC2PXR2_9HYME|nr:hypothetical protein QAD02_023982 [Eretmocerus hayati]